jgi:hypothetical protein
MKRRLGILLIAVGIITSAFGGTLAAAAPKATFCRATDLFCDSFSGTTLDTTKWSPNWIGGTGPVNGAESACYDPSHVTVHDGMLDLRITATQSSCKGATRPETTGIVTTYGKFLTPTTGYRVIWKAYFPAAANGEPANWSVVWDDGLSWPSKGESDTAEVLGNGTTSGSVCWHYHGPGSGDSQGGCDGTRIGQANSVEAEHYLVAGEQGSGTVGGPRVDGVSLLLRGVRVTRI